MESENLRIFRNFLYSCKFQFIVLLPSMRHSEPVTDVTGVGIRFSKRITDCHNQSADWFRNDALREEKCETKQNDKSE